MSNSRIVLIIFLHLALISVIPVYYWKIVFPESEDVFMPRMLADAIILLIAYFSIKRDNIIQPESIKKKSNFYWFLLAISTAILFNSGIYGADFTAGMIHFWPNIDLFQEAVQACIGFDNSKQAIESKVFSKIYYFVWIAFSAAICEEYLYRRLVLTHFRKYGIFLSLILSSVIFELVHFDRFHALYYFHIAIWFGVIYILSGKIWVPMIAHFVFNAYHSVQFIFFQSKSWLYFVWIYPISYFICTIGIIYYLAILGFNTTVKKYLCIIVHLIIWFAVIIAGFLGYDGLFVLGSANC